MLKFLNIVMKVMEMINKNVSMDFDALKKHARMNYWHMDEVALPVSNFSKYLNTHFHIQLFMFFSQQGVTNKSFPCNTVAGSRIGSSFHPHGKTGVFKVPALPKLC